MAWTPPTTDGPATMISPSSASARTARERAARGGDVADIGQRHRAARLGEPVGRADGPAGLARADQQGRVGGRAAEHHALQRGRRRTVDQARELGRDQGRDRDVLACRPGRARRGAREPGAQEHHEPADVRQRQGAQPAARLDDRRHGVRVRLGSWERERAIGWGTPVVPLVCTTRPNPSPFTCLPLSISVITCPASASTPRRLAQVHRHDLHPASRHAYSAMAKSSPGGIANATRGAEIRTREHVRPARRTSATPLVSRLPAQRRD